jgi:hypothetical protein
MMLLKSSQSSQANYLMILSLQEHLEQLSMVEHYSKSLSFDDALSIYHKVNGS